MSIIVTDMHVGQTDRVMLPQLNTDTLCRVSVKAGMRNGMEYGMTKLGELLLVL